MKSLRTMFIFDLDGVIVDTAQYHYQAWKKLAGSLGFDLSEEQNERLKGVSRIQSLDIVLEIGNITATEEQKSEFAARKNADYVERIGRMDKSELLPGVRDFLEASRTLGLGIALASASKNAPFILERVGIRDLFDAVVDGTMVEKAKPDPEVFLRAAAERGAEPSSCIVFEDAVAGVEAAHRAGMPCVGVGDRSVLTDAEIVIPGFAVVTPLDIIRRLDVCAT